jgi:uncharacterized membrane protein
MADEATSRRGLLFERKTLEFERVAFFSDAIFAIAMTLLAVGLDVPRIADQVNSRQLWDALDDMSSQILMFFISFAVLGSFWLAHHRFFGRLGTIDRRTTTVNLIYLAFIAFLPFPTNLLGDYVNNSVAVALYACCIAAISLTEAFMGELAVRRKLYREPPSPAVVRWQRLLSAIPGVYFLASVPVAIVAPLAATYSWIGLFPLMVAIQRRTPKEVMEFFEK